MTQDKREVLFFCIGTLGILWWGFWMILMVMMHTPESPSSSVPPITEQHHRIVYDPPIPVQCYVGYVNDSPKKVR